MTAIQRNSKFFDSQMADAITSLKSGKNISVCGHSRSGKTTFALQLKKELVSKKHDIFYISTKNILDLGKLIRNKVIELAGEDVYSIPLVSIEKYVSELKGNNLAKENLKFLMMAEYDNSVTISQKFIEMLRLFVNSGSNKNVIIIDSVDNIKIDFNVLLNSVKSKFVFLSEFSNFMFDSTFRVNMKNMKYEEFCSFYIDNGMNLSEKILNKIYQLTEGQLFYVNYLGRKIISESEINEVKIDEIILDLFINELNVLYSEKIKALSLKEGIILECMIENNVNTPARISKLIDYPQTAVRRFLTTMEEKGFVKLYDRGLFEICDVMFKKWMKNKLE